MTLARGCAKRAISLITTPIYYANAGPHLGHTYSSLLADSLARFEELKGNKAWLTTGTDEHGLKVRARGGTSRP